MRDIIVGIMSFFKRVRTFGFFSMAAGVALALGVFAFSCSNLQGEGGAQAGAAAGGMQGGAPETGGGAANGAWALQTVSGEIGASGIFPEEFFGESNAADVAAGADSGSKTLLPPASLIGTTVGIKYTVTAKHAGIDDIEATVRQSGSSVSYSVTLPFSSSTDEWTLYVYGKNAAMPETILLGAVDTIAYGESAKDFSVTYISDPAISAATGSISLAIPIDDASGIKSAVVYCGPVGGSFPGGKVVNVSSGKITDTISTLTPGAYNVKIVFYNATNGSGDALYAIKDIANVYANWASSMPYGNAEYIASGGSGFATISAEMVADQKSVLENGIWIGGSGLTGVAANDSNSGTKFKPVATLQRACAIANSLAALDSSKTYTINVQGNVNAGTSANKTATINSGAKVKIIGANAASYYKVSGGATAGTYKLSSGGADVTIQYLNFDKLSVIEVSDGKLTVDDSSVTGGTQGGFLVSAGAELESSQGLTISGCSSAKGGGISCNGTVNLTGAQISGCKSPSGTGSYDGCGGAMFVNGSGAQATLDSCVIGAESASAAASSETLCSNYAAKKGGGIYNNGGTVTLKNGSIVQYNYAEANGGGIYNAGTLSVSAAAFEQNAAGDLGAAVYYEGAASGKSFTLSGACKFGTTSAAQDIGLANANSGIKLSSISKASGSGNIILAPNMASGCVIGTPVISSGANTTNIAYFALGDSTKDVCQLSVATGQGVLYLKTPALNNVSGGDVDESVGAGAFKSAGTTPVTVRSIKMARYEVTYELWYAVYQWAVQRATNPYSFGSCGKEGTSAEGGNQVISTSAPPTTELVNGGEGRGGQRPVTNVSWRDAIVWCNAYSEYNGLTPVYYTDESYTTPIRICNDTDGYSSVPGGQDCPYIKAGANGNTDMANCTAKGARLPTEAEWEFVARGETASAPEWSNEYTMYSDLADLKKAAWYAENSDSVLHCVGHKDPTIRGIRDMLGNNSEWCHDLTLNSSGKEVRREKGGNSISNENSTNKLCNVSYQGSSVPNRASPRTGFRFVQNN